MHTLDIKIEFFDYWHCGSGDSGGNESDSVVVKYEHGEHAGLPYVPGKTLKGLIREMAEADSRISCKELQKWFGNTADDKHKCYKKDEVVQSLTHVSNASISNPIDKENRPFLYKNFKNTKLKDGIAEDNTLREMETVIPLTLYATFSGIGIEEDDSQLTHLKEAIRSIKRIGLNRNRGMGRCEVSVGDKGAKA